MAFPTTPILDDFNSGPNQNLTSRAGWSPNIFWTGEPTLVTDAVPTYAVPSGAGYSSNYWATTFSDCEFYATWGSVLGIVYLYTRITNPNSTTPSGYSLDFTPGTNAWRLQRVTAGAFVLLANGTQAFSSGDTFGLSSIGNLHTIWYNGTSLGSASDANFASGVFATEVQATGRIDSYGGGAVGESRIKMTVLPFTQGAGGGGMRGGPH